jgi:hypothetical protein
MSMTVKARVKHGRLLVDEPTKLPEGTELDLVILDDDLSDDDRVRLHAALDRSDDDVKAGRLASGDDVIARLKRDIS